LERKRIMRMSRGSIMLVVALVAGVAAVVFAARWMQAQAQGNKIAVAALDIEIGARISPEQIKMVDWPVSSVPPGAFAESPTLEGRVAKTSLARGEPIIEGKLAAVGSKGGLSSVVAEGKRAMTVRVNDVVGVAGFALPGNYVDILVNTQDQGGKRGDQDRSISKIVLERILVLAVAQEAGRDATKPKVVNAVTLELAPVDAEKLDLARSVGTLSLVLRNQVDPKLGDTDGATKTSLLDQPAPPPAAPSSVPAPKPAPVKRVAVAKVAPPTAPRGECVEVIRGTAKYIECF
jgi:pilus assembly protein CpaB